MNKNTKKILQMIALAAVLMQLAGCKKAPAQETAAEETTVPVQTTAETTVQTTVESTQETEIIETVPKVTAPEAGSIGYEEYLKLSAEEQQTYYENFDSGDDFFAWLDEAKTEYEAETEKVSNDPESNLDATDSEYFGEEGVEDLE